MKQIARSNLQFPTKILTYYISECGFTDEEIEVLKLRARGKSIVQIAMELSLSEATVSRRIRNIKDKIMTVD